MRNSQFQAFTISNKLVREKRYSIFMKTVYDTFEFTCAVHFQAPTQMNKRLQILLG